MQSPKTLAGIFPSGSPSQVRCSVFWSAFWPRRFFVDDRRSHELNTNHLRLGDFTVRFRFGRTQDPPATQSRLRRSWSAEIRARTLRFFRNLGLRNFEEQITNQIE